MGRVRGNLFAIMIALGAPVMVRAQSVSPIQILYHRINPSALPNLKTAQSFAPGAMHLIQLSGPMTQEMRSKLEGAGVRLADYLPDNSYLVDLSNAKVGALRSLPFIKWVGRFQSEWKKSGDLGLRAFTTPDRQAIAAQGQSAVMVTLFAGRSADSVISAVRRLHGAHVNYTELVGGNLVLSVRLDTRDLDKLAGIADVQSIEEAPEITVRNNVNRWIVQTDIPNSTPFYAHGITGLGQILGLIDLPIDVNHCSFFDPVNPIGPLHRKVLAYNYSQFMSNHGTHVAGIAVGDNGVFDETRGIAYQGKLVYSYLPFDTEASIYNKLTLHHGQGARIHTNSYGNSGTRDYDGLTRGVDSFSYDNEDDLVVFAVTDNFLATTNPENAKNCVAVNASDIPPYDENGVCNGGIGPTADGRRKPEIVGPGCNIISALSGSGCNTFSQSGTSMACPAVAGAIMLLRQYYMDGFYPSGAANVADAFTPSGALLKATLLNSSVNMTSVADYPSNLEGWGRLLIDNACYFFGDSRYTLILADIRNASGMSTNDELTYTCRVIPSPQPLRMTLVWTEPPASASIGTGNAWINDLDLEATAPSNTVYLGNVFSNGASTSFGTKDEKNNVEQIHLPSPETGIWTVKVKAAAVNVGKQGFALILSGGVFPILPAPTASSISPDNGATENSVFITNLAGTNFKPGASVWLHRVGQPDIAAISVNVISPTQIACQINLFGALGGLWDVIVANPDTQQAVLTATFNVTVDCLKGDVNQDGSVNGLDIQRFVDILTSGAGSAYEHCGGDVANVRNGVIGAEDVDAIVDCILNGHCSCDQRDADEDGVNDCNDQCPATPVGASVNAQGCSCSQIGSCDDGDPCTLDSCNAGICSHVLQDGDGDGACDANDLCPNTPVGEPVDANGCSCSQRDSDGDGVNDCIDQCPDTPVGESVNAQGCSCSQIGTCDDGDPCTLDSCTASACSHVFQDADGDGVCDAHDQCPNTPVGEPVDANGCTCSQRDSDGDGVNDCDDQCPNTPIGESVNAQGCSCSQIGSCDDSDPCTLDSCNAGVCSHVFQDADGDEVCDANDLCPDTPIGQPVDANGCPI